MGEASLYGGREVRKAATDRGENKLKKKNDFHTENGPSQGYNLSLTVLQVPNYLHRRCPTLIQFLRVFITNTHLVHLFDQFLPGEGRGEGVPPRR